MLQSDEAARPTAEELLAQVTNSNIAPILLPLNSMLIATAQSDVAQCWTIDTAALAFATAVFACVAGPVSKLDGR